MNLSSRLAEISRTTPDQEALIYHDQKLTYEQLNSKINQFANGLQSLGIKPEDRIVIALSNCPEFVISYYAILRVKAIAIPINPAFTRNEIDKIIKDCQPMAVITSGERAPVFQKLDQEIKISNGIIVIDKHEDLKGTIAYEELISSCSTYFEEDQYKRNDLAAIIYPSATTGFPKGAMLTHHNLYSNALTFAQICKMTAEDRTLMVVPIYHIASQTCVINNTLLSGATLIIHNGWAGPKPVLEIIDKQKITFFFGSPTIYSFLVGYPQSDQYDTKSLRVVYSGGSTLTPEIYEGFRQKYGKKIIEGYGLSETSPMVTSNPIDGLIKVGSIGKALPGVEVRVFDYEGREVPVGQVGEIVVRGPNVMSGYFNQDDETRWIIRNGWLHTGDLAYIDKDGYLFIVDRKKALIIRGDINIDPREIEDVLSMHPAIFDVAVIGVPDAVMGEEIMAFILLRKNEKLEDSQVRKYCETKLSKYKMPRYIRFVENLPKTASGKLMRKEIHRLALRRE